MAAHGALRQLGVPEAKIKECDPRVFGYRNP
jgi:hypothetical protein